MNPKIILFDIDRTILDTDALEKRVRQKNKDINVLE